MCYGVVACMKFASSSSGDLMESSSNLLESAAAGTHQEFCRNRHTWRRFHAPRVPVLTGGVRSAYCRLGDGSTWASTCWPHIR